MLGASGKLGGIVQRFWPSFDIQVSDFVPVFRSKCMGQTGLVWKPGQGVPQAEQGSTVLALWGVTQGDFQALEDNVSLARAAMEFGAAIGARRVIHCSSAAVYLPGPDPLSEVQTHGVPAPYGASKQRMEQAVSAWCAAHPDGPQGACLRIGNVAGADSLFANMKPGGRITLDRFADGSGPCRSYIAPSDLAKVLAQACIAKSLPKVFNVAAPVPTSMKDLADAAGCDVTWRDAPAEAAPLVWLDTSVMQTIFPIDADRAKPAVLIADAKDAGVWP